MKIMSHFSIRFTSLLTPLFICALCVFVTIIASLTAKAQTNVSEEAAPGLFEIPADATSISEDSAPLPSTDPSAAELSTIENSKLPSQTQNPMQLELSAEATMDLLTYQYPTGRRGRLEMDLADISVFGRWRLDENQVLLTELRYNRPSLSEAYKLGFRQFAIVLPIGDEQRFQIGLQLHPFFEDLESQWDQPYLHSEGLPLLFRYRYLQQNDLALRYSADFLGRWLFYMGTGKRLNEEVQHFSKEVLALWQTPFSDIFQMQLGYSRQVFTEPETDFLPSERALLRFLLQTPEWFWSLEGGTLRDEGQRLLNEGMADEIDHPALANQIANGQWSETLLRTHFDAWSVGLRAFFLKPWTGEGNFDVMGGGLTIENRVRHGRWGLAYSYSQRSEDHSLQSTQEDDMVLYYTITGDKLINL